MKRVKGWSQTPIKGHILSVAEIKGLTPATDCGGGGAADRAGRRSARRRGVQQQAQLISAPPR
jgi:hypothetical protein